MRIVDLKIFEVGNPWKNWVFVKLYTDEGLTGLGEATGGLSTKPWVGAVEELRRHVIGEDPLHPERLAHKLFKARYLNNSKGISAIEQASWDILGKSLKAPLWQIFGGKYHETLRVYANGWYRGPRDPAFFAERAILHSSSTPSARASMRSTARSATAWCPWSRLCATRSAPTWRSWSRCTVASTR